MCGIVGYAGHRSAVPVLIKGLEHLEYRGYDSAGLACLDQSGALSIVKEKGKLESLKRALTGLKLSSHLGIGHTRWATHGEPSRVNAHPHLDGKSKIALVHNGIIENYSELKAQLRKEGCRFVSQTDTEVAAQLIGKYYEKGNFEKAFKKALPRLRGFFAFVALAKDHPGKIFAFKRSNPLVIGLGENENFIASDVPALLPYTKQVIYMEDDEYAVLTAEKVELFSMVTGKSVFRKPATIRWSVSEACKTGYPHFMLKEIYEQPQVVRGLVHSRIKNGKIVFDTLNPAFLRGLKKIKKIHFVSCGTAYHAGLIGNYMMGECVKLPVEATVSSEFRYEDPAVDKEDLVILVTQSGETADTLAALREAKAKGATTLAIVNVVGSTIAREADSVIYTNAGPEIGVASTKAYLAQLVTIALFSIYFGMIHPRKKPGLTRERANQLLRGFLKLPGAVEKVLKQDKRIRDCARLFRSTKNFLYLGRGYNFPNALEGALKLKEISYAHAHGYAAGEMKHGPIALIDKTQPVICLCHFKSKTYDKMLSNIEEIRARKGRVISVGTAGDVQLQKISERVFFTPDTDEMFSPILTAIPLQLFAYHMAVLNNRDVDQPRNLAKSVTVE